METLGEPKWVLNHRDGSKSLEDETIRSAIEPLLSRAKDGVRFGQTASTLVARNWPVTPNQPTVPTGNTGPLSKYTAPSSISPYSPLDRARTSAPSKAIHFHKALDPPMFTVPPKNMGPRMVVGSLKEIKFPGVMSPPKFLALTSVVPKTHHSAKASPKDIHMSKSSHPSKSVAQQRIVTPQTVASGSVHKTVEALKKTMAPEKFEASDIVSETVASKDSIDLRKSSAPRTSAAPHKTIASDYLPKSVASKETALRGKRKAVERSETEHPNKRKAMAPRTKEAPDEVVDSSTAAMSKKMNATRNSAGSRGNPTSRTNSASRTSATSRKRAARRQVEPAAEPLAEETRLSSAKSVVLIPTDYGAGAGKTANGGMGTGAGKTVPYVSTLPRRKAAPRNISDPSNPEASKRGRGRANAVESATEKTAPKKTRRRVGSPGPAAKKTTPTTRRSSGKR